MSPALHPMPGVPRDTARRIPAIPVNRFDAIATQIIRDEFERVIARGKDIAAALQDARELTNALGESLLAALEAAEALEKRFDPAWHPETLRFTWRDKPPHVRARADTALTALQGALEAYASPSLSFQVFALALRGAFGHA